MNITKRDGTTAEYDKKRIYNAIYKAFKAINVDENEKEIEDVCNTIANSIPVWDGITVEDIQDSIEELLNDFGYYDVAKAYIIYRSNHELLRVVNTTDKSIFELIAGTNEYWNKENGNKRANRTSTQRDYIAGITSTDIARRVIFPHDVIEAHDNGIIHLHDLDYVIHSGITNCCLINLQDMLNNGTVINDVLIEPPHRFTTACTIATQIILGVTSMQYGGCTVSIAHLAPFLRKSKENFQKKYPECWERLLKEELSNGVQTFNYQVNSMTNSNGQSPFVTVHIDLEEIPEYEEEVKAIATEFLEQRILGFKNKLGVYVTPAFPKIIVVLRDKYFSPQSKYYDFIKLCAECTAKRMVPDYMSEKNMIKYKGCVVPAMGCRSLLKPIFKKDGTAQLWGRFNLGVCTISLPYIAYMSNDEQEFWENLDKHLELCRKAQLVRVKRIANSTSDCAPLLWQYGAFARLAPHTKLSEIIYNGWASISLGYAGLFECVNKMTGESQSSPKGFEFAEKVMQYLDKKTQEWVKEDNLGWSVYGTPIESTTYKFAKAIKKFGYDRDYITNSIHVPVYEEINPIQKLKIEGRLQKYSTGGQVSYIESANMTKNTDAIIMIMKAINDYCLYAEINGKNDFCENCGSTEEQKIDDNGNFFCPNCGCTDPQKLYHPRRLCGYIGTSEVNKGRAMDIKNRYVHLDNHICK